MPDLNRTSYKKKKAPKKKRPMAFSKVIALLILIIDGILVLGTLFLTYLAITLNYLGDLGYLIALIGFAETATGYVLGRYLVKSERENTRGGIVYDSQLGNRDPTEI